MAIRTSDVDIKNDGTYNQYGSINVYSSSTEDKTHPFTNKDLVIPFTLSKANGAQGGTYVPRNDLLVKIEESFKSDRIVFLSGIGGYGKSELARAYGYKHRDDYKEIFWLTCDDATPNFMHLMERADLNGKIEKSEMKNFSDNVLIIIDNCNSEAPSFLLDLENWTGKAMILVTTRLNSVGGYESIIPVESDDPDSFAYSVFEKNYCKKSRRTRTKTIHEEESAAIRTICRIIQYNTMVVSLIAVRLREYNDLSILECAQKIRHGIGSITGKIKYAKDKKAHSEEMKEILKFLFADLLAYSFSTEEKAILTILSLTPARWYEIDFISSLLAKMSDEYFMGQLLDFGWLQGNGDRVAIHPLIAEVISDQPIIIHESFFFENLLKNYLGLPDEYLGRGKFLLNKVFNLSGNVKPELKIAVMLAVNSMDFESFFHKIHPEVKVAYFLYVNNGGKRYFTYRDLAENKNYDLAENETHENSSINIKLLRVYNTGVQYKLDLNVLFHRKMIEEVPAGLCYRDHYVRSLVFSDKIRRISEGAFLGCSLLSGELHLFDNLQEIGKKAFMGCSGLSGELRLPDSLQNIGKDAFLGCTGFSGNLHLPDSLQNIGKRAFLGCTGFSGNLHLPNSLQHINFGVFMNCTGFSGSLHLPDSIQRIADFAFLGCSGFNGELHLPDNLQRIANFAFLGCSGFRGELLLPVGLESIGYMAFMGCTGFSGELCFPGSLQSVDDMAFLGCSGFSGELHLPDSLHDVAENVFLGCTGITIGDYHFRTAIDHNDYPFFKFMALLFNSFLLSMNSRISEVVDLTSNNSFKKFFNNITSDNKSVKANEKEKVLLPNTSQIIGDSAYSGCSNLSDELHLPDNTQRIGNYDFTESSDLSGNLYLPDSLQNIGEAAFMGSSDLSGELHLPDSLQGIGDLAFFGCNGFSGELHLPDSLQGIGDLAFFGCNGFSGELHLPNSLQSIGEEAFLGCSGFRGELRLPNSLQSIGRMTFMGCRGFSGELHLPNSLQSIGEEAFLGCSGFRGELRLPNSLQSIDYEAFLGCSGLSGELHLPANLQYIGDSSFEGCIKIKRIIFHNPLITIDGIIVPYTPTIIVGYKDSTAEIYAREHGLEFEELE